jgi:hypothetical protein
MGAQINPGVGNNQGAPEERRRKFCEAVTL